MKDKTRFSLMLLLYIISGTLKAQAAKPESSAEDLAKKLSNPVAALISVPFQNNMDIGIGQYNGSRYTLNFQLVIPINLTPKLNLISRFIIPIISQCDITGDGTSQNGLGDAVVSVWFSPSDKKGFSVGRLSCFSGTYCYKRQTCDKKVRSRPYCSCT